MEAFDVYRDIAERTDGEIYIGVVGPVRTGKSTLVKKFLELLVIPNILEEYDRQRTIDEMPQSGAGRTVMTTEPKFVPDEGVTVNLGDAAQARVRLVDSVGYPVEGALGYTEEDGPRMVTTPWFDYDIPFEEAAEIGTRKVIADHSTIGLVVTTDGTIGEIPRENYVEAERRAITQLKELGKPFLVLLNTVRPQDPQTLALVDRLEDEYGAAVLAVNCSRLDKDGLTQILEQVLYEFPVREIGFALPGWVQELDPSHRIRDGLDAAVAAARDGIVRVRDIDNAVKRLAAHDGVTQARLASLDLGSGTASVVVEVEEGLFYQALREITGVDVDDKQALMRVMRELVYAREEFDRLGEAWREAKELGYGVVYPRLADMDFQEPEMIKKGHQFGVRLKAQAPSFHIIRTDVAAEYTPILGSERQSEDLIRYLMEKFEDDPRRIWESNIFGKSLNELLRDGVRGKLEHLPEPARKKFQETLERMVNEGSGGLICIIL